jgi:hypothetical protein
MSSEKKKHQLEEKEGEEKKHGVPMCGIGTALFSALICHRHRRYFRKGHML